MKTQIYMNEQQALDTFSLIIIRQVLNGRDSNVIINGLVDNGVPRDVAQKLVLRIVTQLASSN